MILFNRRRKEGPSQGLFLQAVKCYEAICGSGNEEPTQEARIRLELAGLLLQRSFNLDEARQHLERAVRNPTYHVTTLASPYKHTAMLAIQELRQGRGWNRTITVPAHSLLRLILRLT